MPRYLCPNCRKVSCGWAIRYKYKNKCPNCDSWLQEVFNNEKSRKVEGYHKEDPEDPLSKLLRLDI